MTLFSLSVEIYTQTACAVQRGFKKFVQKSDQQARHLVEWLRHCWGSPQSYSQGTWFESLLHFLFLLMCTLGSSSDGSNLWVPATRMGNGVSASGFGCGYCRHFGSEAADGKNVFLCLSSKMKINKWN